MELFLKVNFTSMKLNEISIVRTIRKCIGTRYDMSYDKVTTIQKIRNKTLRENVILIFSIFFFRKNRLYVTYVRNRAHKETCIPPTRRFIFLFANVNIFKTMLKHFFSVEMFEFRIRGFRRPRSGF